MAALGRRTSRLHQQNLYTVNLCAYLVNLSYLQKMSSQQTSQIGHHLAKLAPVPAKGHAKKVFYVPTDLDTAEYVFVRKTPMTKALEAPYRGPYRQRS